MKISESWRRDITSTGIAWSSRSYDSSGRLPSSSHKVGVTHDQRAVCRRTSMLDVRHPRSGVAMRLWSLLRDWQRQRLPPVLTGVGQTVDPGQRSGTHWPIPQGVGSDVTCSSRPEARYSDGKGGRVTVSPVTAALPMHPTRW